MVIGASFPQAIGRRAVHGALSRLSPSRTFEAAMLNSVRRWAAKTP
jgi:hypothetical protein